MYILHVTPGFYPATAWGSPTKVVCQNSQPAQQGSARGYFDLVFVGPLIPRKGWDVPLYALRGPKDRDWRLHVAGDGVDRDKFVGLCARFGMTDSVCFYGRLPNSETISTIRKSDLLVLPSRWAGRGRC